MATFVAVVANDSFMVMRVVGTAAMVWFLALLLAAEGWHLVPL